MKKIALLLASAAYLGSCAPGISEQGKARVTQDADSLNNGFREYCNQFIDSLWSKDPVWATSIGYHKYDSLLPLPDKKQQSAYLSFLKSRLDSLGAFDQEQLNPSHQIDWLMVKNFMNYAKWQIEVFHEKDWNPSIYNPSGLIAFMLSENYAPITDRLQTCHARIRQIPAYYTAAMQRIQNPVRELSQLAIDQNEGGLYIFEKDFVDSVKAAPFSQAEKDQMIADAAKAKSAVQEYVAFLRKGLPQANRSFRLGKDLYEQKFAFEIESSYTAGQLYDSAVARKEYLHGQMAILANQLWPKYFGQKARPTDRLELIRKVIDTLSHEHVRPADFQTAIERQIPELVDFVNRKQLLYLDPSKPLVVRKEPAYMAGVAGASISAPGPYDKEGNTYYNVGGLEGWPADKAESYLREYNHYILQILNIHEAIPGHYTQLVYANRSPSLVKSIFGNGAMIEGWAVYTEQMMLENGYGNDAPEMWLMWYKWNLRTVCNTILDYSIHVLDLQKEKALDLLIREAFQQKAEAEGKWKRATVTSVQLCSYYAGYKEIIDLREALRKKEGKKFDLRVFHEKFLSYGSAPVKYIARMMLQH